MSNDSLRFGPLTAQAVHLCVDVQGLFSTEGPWPAPWMERVLPVLTELAGRFPERTIFTRFIPPNSPEDVRGGWRRFYERWRCVTRQHCDPALLELLPPLGRFVPPALRIDKPGYSAFTSPTLLPTLRERRVNTVIVSGGETDICVLATVLDAVDIGLRVVVATDAVCSSSDAGHDALLGLFSSRFSQQIETADSNAILTAWQR